jgi:hypothetical protein
VDATDAQRETRVGEGTERIETVHLAKKRRVEREQCVRDLKCE